MNTVKQIESQIKDTKETLEFLKAELETIMVALAENEIRLESCDDETQLDSLIDEIAESNESLRRQRLKVRLRQRQAIAKLEALESQQLVIAKREKEELASDYCGKIEVLVEEYKLAAQKVVNLNAQIKAGLSEARRATGLGFSPDSISNPKLYTIEGTLSKNAVGYTTGAEIAAGVEAQTEEVIRYEFLNLSLIQPEKA